jgi:Ala-tRNA(Pro) deacylase
MLGLVFGFYILAMLGSLILTGSASIEPAHLVAVGLLAVIAAVIFQGLCILFRDWEGEHEEEDRYRIATYLGARKVPFLHRGHPRAVDAQHLAESLHISGDQVGKVVMVRADGETWMAVLPASEQVDFDALARALGASEVQMMSEEEFGPLFRGSEIGAEPPFGRLYGLPVVVDSPLMKQPRMFFRAGSHHSTVGLAPADYDSLEHPRVADFGIRAEHLNLAGKEKRPLAGARGRR